MILRSPVPPNNRKKNRRFGQDAHRIRSQDLRGSGVADATVQRLRAQVTLESRKLRLDAAYHAVAASRRAVGWHFPFPFASRTIAFSRTAGFAATNHWCHVSSGE